MSLEAVEAWELLTAAEDVAPRQEMPVIRGRERGARAVRVRALWILGTAARSRGDFRAVDQGGHPDRRGQRGAAAHLVREREGLRAVVGDRAAGHGEVQ